MNFVEFFMPQIGAMLVLLLLAKMIAGRADVGREARAEGGQLQFEPNRRSFWGVYSFVAAVAYVIVASLIQGVTSASALAVSSIGLAFVLFLLMAFPATIVADEKGLEQIFWLRTRKRIAWKDLKSFAIDQKTGELRIAARTGVKIVHTRQLPERDKLLAEIEKHSIERVTVIPPAPAASEVVASGKAASNTSAA